MDDRNIKNLEARLGFSIFEINDQISNPYEKSKLYYRIEKIVYNNVDLAEVLLVSAIEKFKKPSDLYLISLCFRWGVSPNIYVKTGKEIYEKHILVFFLEALRSKWDNNMLDFTTEQFNGIIPFIIVLMSELGTLMTLPAYRFAETQQIDPALFKATEKMMRFNNDKLKSLQQYISEIGINVQADVEEKLVIRQVEDNVRIYRDQRLISVSALRNTLTDSQWKLVILLCDKPDSAANEINLDNVFSLDDILMARANNIFDKQPLSFKNRKTKTGVFTTVYYKCISACDLSIFRNLLMNGVEINYFDINYIIQNILNRNNKDLQGEYLAFLKMAVGYGVEMDTYQLASLTANEKDYENEVKEIQRLYSMPYFDKIKNSKTGLVPKRLHELCFSFQISLEKTKAEMLEALQKIYETDLELVKSAFTQRYHFRLSSAFVPFLDFNKPAIPIIKIENIEMLKKNPELVNDHQTITLEGDDGLFYAYNSDYFEALLTDDQLVHSSVDGHVINLPILTRLEIEKRLELLKIYSINPNIVKTVEDAYLEMRVPDVIGNGKTNVIIESAKISLMSNGVSIESIKRVNNLDKFMKETYMIMAPLSEDTDVAYYRPTTFLSSSHRWASFYRLVYHTIKNYPERYQLLVDYLNRIQ